MPALRIFCLGLLLACCVGAAPGAEPSAGAAAVWSPAPAGSPSQDVDPRGRFVSTTLQLGGARFTVALREGPLRVGRAVILAWISRAVAAIADYYDGFPAPAVDIVVLTGGAEAIGAGVTEGGRLVHIAVGRDCSPADLAADWKMTHELIHVSFPALDERFLWMEEGLATYLEPVMRARRGELSPETMWGDLVDGLPQGQPAANDPGLDGTRDWGRTYWGGAGFWLLADLRLRTATAGRRSLQDVLRGIHAAGGTGATDWNIDQVLAAAERASGSTVVAELYRRMGPIPMPLALDALWRELGVARRPGGVRFDETAPSAAQRQAITAPAAALSSPP